MAKKKKSSAAITIFTLLGSLAAVFGIYKGIQYIKSPGPNDGDNTSSEQPPIMDYPVNVYVDGKLSNGYIIFNGIGDTHIIEVKNKVTNTFYDKAIELMVAPTSKSSSYVFTDLNGDDLYVRFQAKIIKGEFEPVKVYFSSTDFNFYVYMHIVPNPATGIEIGGGNIIYK